MRGEIHRLQRRLGIAAVYVTHDREEALSMSDRVIVMEQGRIVQVGTPRDLYRRPRSRFVADFVGKVGLIALHREGDGWASADGTRIQVAPGEPCGPTALGAVRPENIRLLTGGEAVAAPDANLLSGVVTEAQYLGPFTEYVVDVAGASLRAFAQTDLPVGAPVTLGIAPEHLVLVPDA